MKFNRKNITITLIVFLIILILEWVLYGQLTLIETSNLTFYFAGFFLIIGLFGLVFSSESFDFFHFSIRKAFIHKSKRIEPDEIPPDPHALSKAVGKSYQTPLTIGSVLLLISLLCLWNYYF